jgi:hypothetical protein
MPAKIAAAKIADAGPPEGRRMRSLLETLSYVATTVGIFLLIFQLSSDASYKKSERSLSLVNEYIGGKIGDYRVVLLKPWIERKQELEIIRNAGGAKQEDVDAFVEFVMKSHDAKYPADRIEIAVHELGSFFDRVQLCITSAVCDRKIALDYFRSPATQFHCLYGTVLAKQGISLGTPELGTGLVRLRSGKKC